jgi:predicted DNA-binding ribbon-helix-helix protein
MMCNSERGRRVALHRTQVLFEPEQHRALTEMARRQRRSLSDLVREIVQREIDHQRDEQREIWARRMAIIEEAHRRNEDEVARNGPRPTIDLVAELEEGRAERDERVFGNFPAADR